MQAVEVAVPPVQEGGNERHVEKPQAPAQEPSKLKKEDEAQKIIRQIRNISAFCDCV
jgi:hypothetical protein